MVIAVLILSILMNLALWLVVIICMLTGKREIRDGKVVDEWIKNASLEELEQKIGKRVLSLQAKKERAETVRQAKGK